MVRDEDHWAPEGIGDVMLALHAEEQPTSCVLAALSMATKLEAELQVVRVLPEPPRLRRTSPLFESEAAIEKRRLAHTLTVRWLSSELGEAARFMRVVVAQGDFVEQVAHRAKSRRVRLIVVSPEVRRAGAVVTSLARAAETPVLGPRSGGRGGPILAATDMSHPAFPVLWEAALLARQLAAPLVTFHNIPQTLLVPPHPIVIPDLVMIGATPPEARRERLTDVASLLPIPSTSVVRSEVDAVDAILGEAATLRAELIVVGTHYRSWWDRALNVSVAAEIVGRAKRSVLVTPIGQAS
jgi:nucleotide-binding universal stress UspA family protein